MSSARHDEPHAFLYLCHSAVPKHLAVAVWLALFAADQRQASVDSLVNQFQTYRRGVFRDSVVSAPFGTAEGTFRMELPGEPAEQ